MKHHIKQKWYVYAIILQTLYAIMNPGPINSALTKLLCHE